MREHGTDKAAARFFLCGDRILTDEKGTNFPDALDQMMELDDHQSAWVLQLRYAELLDDRCDTDSVHRIFLRLHWFDLVRRVHARSSDRPLTTKMTPAVLDRMVETGAAVIDSLSLSGDQQAQEVQASKWKAKVRNWVVIGSRLSQLAETIGEGGLMYLAGTLTDKL